VSVGRRADALAVFHSLAGPNRKLERVGRLKQQDNRRAEVEVAEEFALGEVDLRSVGGGEVLVGEVTARPSRVCVRRQRLKNV